MSRKHRTSPGQTGGHRHGFTLLEIIVVLAVVAALAAVLTPLATGYVEDARDQRARQDLRTVGEALLAAQSDLGDFPIFRAGSQMELSDDSTFDVLVGPGALPSLTGTGWSAAHASGADADSLSHQLIQNAPAYATTGRFRWRGPYVDDLAPDPWGNAYLVNAENLRPAQPDAGYVVSAGPDGVLSTPYDLDRSSGDVMASGDDLLFRVR